MFIILPVHGQDLNSLITELLNTAGDYQHIAPVAQIIRQNEDLFRFVPSICPIREKYRLTGKFEQRIHPIRKELEFHKGVDLAAEYAATIHATADGSVIFTGDRGGYGKTVIINHRFGFVTQYSHLTLIYCRTSQIVKKGDVIGFVGNTGISTGNHLHYEIQKNNRNINPLNFISWN